MRDLILISGNIGAGKDTVANILAERGYVHLKFADVLKDIAAAFIGIYKEDKSHRECELFTDRKLKEEAVVWVTTKGKEFTPRELLKTIGTECFRTSFGGDVWAEQLEKAMDYLFDLYQTNKFVVSDCRFPNEYTYFNQNPNYNTFLIYIEKAKVTKSKEILSKLLQYLRLAKKPHPSEQYQSYLRKHADWVLLNDGSINDLKSKLFEKF